MPTWLLDLLSPGGAVGTLINTVASFIPNPEEKAKAQLAMQQAIITAALTADSEQRAINKTEAASGSMFVAGWRPAVGWLCIVTLAWCWILAPFVSWTVALFNSHIPQLPVLNKDEASTLLYALLGIGAMRTADKIIPGGVTNAITGVFSGGKKS